MANDAHAQAPAGAVAPALPITLIGGYLGAGKTTLVNHLLRHANGLRIAVLVNDFGELPIDADLIEGAEGGLLRLAGSCVCCSFGDDLTATLMTLTAMDPAPQHVLLETSGVALPAGVARSLRLLPMLRLDSVVVMADASTIRQRAVDPYVGDTVSAQLHDADLIVLNKLDLVAPARVDELRAWLGGFAPRARILEADRGRLPPSVVMHSAVAGMGDGAQEGSAPDREAAMLGGPLRFSASHSAELLFESCSLRFDHAVDCAALAQALSDETLGLVRAKGVMRNADGQTCSVQVVGQRAEVQALARPPVAEGRLACIALRGRLDRARIEAIVAAAARQPAVQGTSIQTRAGDTVCS